MDKQMKTKFSVWGSQICRISLAIKVELAIDNYVKVKWAIIIDFVGVCIPKIGYIPIWSKQMSDFNNCSKKVSRQLPISQRKSPMLSWSKTLFSAFLSVIYPCDEEISTKWG